MFRIASVAIVALALVATPALAQDLWLHVHVDENDAEETTVRVNVPLSLVASVLPTIEASPHVRQGKLEVMRDLQSEGIDIFEMWQELRNAPDGEYVRVRSKTENVRIHKLDEIVHIDVDESSDGEQQETVRVRLPMAVMDALLSNGDDTLNLVAAVEALSEFEGEDLVTVDDGSSKVRIWVDRIHEAP
jgi:hypothetical protein